MVLDKGAARLGTTQDLTNARRSLGHVDEAEQLPVEVNEQGRTL